MHKSSFKALYVFLTSLLGMMLLVMLHRSLFVIYDLLGIFFPNVFIFQATAYTVQTVDFISLLSVMFIGGWYGVWLGLHWFDIVYEHNSHNKIFHALVPHNWRKSQDVKDKSVSAGVPKKIVHASSSRSGATSFKSYRRQPEVDTAWNFDDLAEVQTETRKPARKTVVRKPAVKKTVVKKVVRKTVVKV